MPWIKKIYLEGFKSFAKPTEIIFDRGLNIIVGPNGSGKSNIIDAICFVLGRLSSKSLRAERTSSLIFKGSKTSGPSEKAIIKLFFDNSDEGFSIENEKPKEVIIERILKKDGSSIYRINGKNKTRNELLELLSQANLNPYGFNLIQQQEVFKFVEIKPEERRKLIEDLAGISIYETRRQKALNELTKTEEKLKEIKAILNEKLHFLKNLEKEKRQALIYKKLKETINLVKFSILYKKIEEKEKGKKDLIEKLNNEEEKKKKNENNQKDLQERIKNLRKQIEEIDSYIEQISGIEQNTLQEEITNLKTQFAKLEVKKNSLINQLDVSEEKIKRLETEKNELKKEINELKEKREEKIDIDESNQIKLIEERIEKNKEKISRIRKKLEEIEKQKKEYEINKERLNWFNREFLFLTEKIRNKKEEFNRVKSQLTPLTLKIREIREVRDQLEINQKKLNANLEAIKEKERIISGLEKEIELGIDEKEELKKLKICPKCKRELTEEHRKKLVNEIDKKIKQLKLKLSGFSKEREEIEKVNSKLKEFISKLKKELEVEEKNKLLKERLEELKKDIGENLKRKKDIETKIERLSNLLPTQEKALQHENSLREEYEIEERKLRELVIEKEKIKNKIISIQNLEFEIDLKEKEVENIQRIIEQTKKEKLNALVELKKLEEEINETNQLLEIKLNKADEINLKFSSLIEKKNKLHGEINKAEAELSSLRTNSVFISNQINQLKIELAKIDAEIKTLVNEKEENIENWQKLKPIHLPLIKLQDKLEILRNKIESIGNVNLLALETYQQIKKDVEGVEVKVKEIEKEKDEIIKQIERINKEKRKVFMDLFEKINKEFNDNFARLSDKGHAKLLLENPKDPFEGGIEIAIQIGKGKYFDSTSLSGGEKVLIALAFIFAIQSLNPYHFYVFDEIDAALDKRNSERLAALLKTHIAKNQCIIITHNDATINQADLIYGVSMQNGISKVISLKL